MFQWRRRRLEIYREMDRCRLAKCNDYEDEKRQLVNDFQQAVRSQVAGVTALMETHNKRGLVLMELEKKRLAERLLEKKIYILQKQEERIMEEADELIASDQELERSYHSE
jgi:hypothetical protein